MTASSVTSAFFRVARMRSFLRVTIIELLNSNMMHNNSKKVYLYSRNHLSSRMAFVVLFLEALDRDMRINLRG
jgi:hypothetical protein